jgi:HK97 family phage major capsid protein
LNWAKLVSKLRALETPYSGPDDDYDAVKSFMTMEGYPLIVEDSKTDESFDIKELFDSRKGKPLDISAEAEEARVEAMVNDRVAAVLAEKDAVLGKDGYKSQHRHDVKVGRSRIEDDPQGGFKHVGEFFNAVIEAGGRGDVAYSPKEGSSLDAWTKTAASTYGSGPIGSDGGFAVPVQYRTEIMKRVQGEDSILSRTNQISIGAGNSMVFPYDEDEPWNSSGIQAEWMGEAGTYTQRKPLIVSKELKLRKLVTLVPLTEELMSDAPAIGSYVSSKAADVIDFAVGEAIFRGVGATQPLGFLNSGSLIQVAKVSNQVADTITGTNLLAMWTRMYGPYRSGAVWFANQDIEPKLLRASLLGDAGDGNTETTGFGSFVYMPAGGFSQAPFPTLFGRPVIYTQHCETLGDLGDICFCNMSQYATLMKGGIESASSVDLWFDQDITALKFRLRVDGMPWDDNTIAARDGTTTYSAFVTLAERA